MSECNPDKSSRPKQFKFPTKMEKNKLFVKGLPYSMTEADVRSVFEPYGDLKDVRIVTFRNGHSKGIAFIEFHKEVSFRYEKLNINIPCCFGDF